MRLGDKIYVDNTMAIVAAISGKYIIADTAFGIMVINRTNSNKDVLEYAIDEWTACPYDIGSPEHKGFMRHYLQSFESGMMKIPDTICHHSNDFEVQII